MSTQPQSCGASGRGRGAGTATRRFAPAAADIGFAPDSGRSERFGLNDPDLAVCATRSVTPVSDPSAPCRLRRSRPSPMWPANASPEAEVGGGRGGLGADGGSSLSCCSRLRQRAGLARGGSPIWRTVAPGRGTARTNSRGPSLHLRRIARSPSSRASGILHATRSAKSQRCRAPPQPPSYYKNPHRPRRRHAK